MKSEAKIYYAHSKQIYGTAREAEELDFLERKYPTSTIINPKDLGELKGIKKYLKIVGKCNLVVAYSRCHSCCQRKEHIGDIAGIFYRGSKTNNR